MSQENDSKNSADIPPQYRLVPDPQQIEEERRAAANPGMRSPQSIVAERIKDKDTSKSPIYETSEDKVMAAANPGMRTPKNLQAEQVALGVVEINTAENLSQMERQRRIIRQEQDREAARMAAQIEQRRRSFNRGQLRHSEMASVIERMKHGGGIQVPTFEENDRILREDETVLLEEVGGMTGMVGKLNKATRQEAKAPETKEQPNQELLQTAVAVPDELRKPVDQKKVAELVEEATAHPTEAMITKVAEVNQYLNENLATKTPTEILQYLLLDKFLKAEDIQIATQDGPRIDPVKREYILNAVRLRLATEAAGTKGVGHVNEEIGAKYKGSREAADKIRAAIKKNTPATADEAADQKLHSYVELFKKRVQEEFTRANNAGKALPNDNKFRFPVAQEIVGQLESVLPDVTAEEFLAAVSVIESQENVQKASQDFQKKAFEQFNSGIKRKLLDSPLWIKIKREDIVSPTEIDALLTEYNRNPSPALEQELAEVTHHTDNRQEAIQYFGLSGLIKPEDLKTDSPYELTAAADNDRLIYFQNAIRLKHIVHDRLNQKVDSIVKAEFGTSPSTSIDAYTKLQAFIAEKNPDVTADDKRLLQEYYTGFGEMVNQEIRKQSLIFKDQERVFIDIGEHKATRIPARVVLSTARKVAAERFVRANQAQLPEGMTPEQFLAGMSVADTYRFSEDKLKEEVFDWYRKNKPRLNSDYNEGNERQARRRIPVPFLRRGQAPPRPSPPETPPAPQPPNVPGNPSDNQPPGGNPPEPPRNPPPQGGGGAPAGGAPSPDAQPDNDVDDDDSVIVDAHVLSADEPLFDLPEGLPIDPIKLSEIHADLLITDEDFISDLNKKRTEDQDNIKEELASQTPRGILFKYNLEGKFTEGDVENQNPKLIDAILIQNIIGEKMQNKTVIDEIIKQAEKQNPNFKLVADLAFKNDNYFTRLYTAFIIDLEMFVNSSEFQDAADKQLALHDERMRLALEYYNLNKLEFSEEMTPERLLAVLSLYDTFSELNSHLFDELFAKSQGEEPHIPKPPSLPPQPPAPPRTGAEPPKAPPAQPPVFEAFKEAPTRREKRNIRQDIGKWLRNTINREPPISFEQSKGLLITNPNVTRVNTRGFINPDLFIDRLRLTDSAYRDRIKKNEIELRDLPEVVNKWGLQDIISEDLIEQDSERVRESQQLIDAIIIRSMAAELFNEKTNKQAIDFQLREFIPRKTFEQYAAHKKVVFELLPEFRREWADRLSELSKSLPFVTVKERDTVNIKARKEAAQKLFNEHLTEMPQNSSPEKLLAALSLRETYVQIQDELFSDLMGMYRWLLPPDDDEDNISPGHPRYPSGGGSGGSGSGGPDQKPGNSPPPNNGPSGGPAPDSNPSPGGAQAATYAEASDVEDQVAAVLAGIQNNSGTQSSLDEIQKRLERRAAGKN